jgi:hypothetical protein
MPTVTLRHTSEVSATGWDASTANFGDGNTSTSATQNSTTCNFTGVLADLDSGLSGATINSFTISLNAKAGRAGASTVDMSLVHSSDGVFATETESFPGSQGTRTTSARTTQQDGSSALTFAYINNCNVRIEPNTQGTTAYDLFVTVDYTAAAGYGNDVMGVASANIEKVDGIATANIEKIIGV